MSARVESGLGTAISSGVPRGRIGDRVCLWRPITETASLPVRPGDDAGFAVPHCADRRSGAARANAESTALSRTELFRRRPTRPRNRHCCDLRRSRRKTPHSRASRAGALFALSPSTALCRSGLGRRRSSGGGPGMLFADRRARERRPGDHERRWETAIRAAARRSAAPRAGQAISVPGPG